MFESWAMDIAYTLRRLRKQPTYAALTVLTLSLGVAGTAAVYAVAQRLLWDPLPIPADEDVALFWGGSSWSPRDFLYLRPHFEGFQSVAAFWRTDATFRPGDAPARAVDAISASAELFEVLGVSPAIGPGFQPGDDAQGAGRVAVLSHSVWQDLGGDPSIIGQRIEFSGLGHTVVGVMPAGFWFPDPAVGVWMSASLNPEDPVMNYRLIGRFGAGLGIEVMGPHIERITTLLGDRFTYSDEEYDKTRGAELTPLRDHLVGHLRPAFQALLAGMALLLVIACVNVAALMLGQVDSRGTELAVRTALGAGRPRLLRQLVVESIAIGLLAGLVGTGLALLGFRFLVNVLPLGALAETATVDGSLLWVAIGVALLAATAVALVPAVSVSRGDLRARLVRSGTGRLAGRGSRLEGGLVVGQVALVLLMAAGATLLIRSVTNLRAIDAGVETAGVGVIDVITPVTIATEDRVRMLREVIAAVDALPGVASAASTQRLPLRGGGNVWGIRVEQRPELHTTTTFFRMVTPDYFETMGIPLRDGRGLLETDRLSTGEGVVVINQSLADRYFPGMNPIGQRLAFAWGDSPRWDRIVGVVENVAESDLTADPEPTRYVHYEHSPGPEDWLNPWQTIVFRTQDGRDPAALLGAARAAIHAAAPAVAVQEMTTMPAVFDRAIGPARQVMTLLSLLSGLALGLGGVGVYGVVSHFVNRRKREWGIRLALGMRPRRVTGRIVRGGAALVGTGVALGLVAFLALSRLLASFLHGVGTMDALALAAATAVLMATGLLAAYVPARRASRIDPARVLREQ